METTNQFKKIVVISPLKRRSYTCVRRVYQTMFVMQIIYQNKKTIKMPKQKITPFLWFDNQAEEAMNFYTSVFKNSRIVNVQRYGDAGPGPKGTVMTGTF